MAENENCLHGMRCPACKSLGPFKMTTRCWAEVHDDGICETHDHEWVDNDQCHCVQCEHKGYVSDFQTQNQEEQTEVERVREWFEGKSHWDTHPDYPAEDWRFEAAADATRLGYKEWCLHQAEQKDDECGSSE